jgi:hypothetical protein
MNPFGFIRKTSKGMNQILKERGARRGEVSTEAEVRNETWVGVTTRGEANKTTGTETKSNPCGTAAVEDWFIILQRGLSVLPE